MRSALSKLTEWLQQRAVPHPAAATLLASLDRELEPLENARITAHLARCAACRKRLEQLQTGLRLYDQALAPLPAGFSAEEGLERLRAAIHAWNNQHPEENARQAPLSPAFWEMLTSELSIYMGLRTATALLQTCHRPGVQLAELNSVIEPMVTGFFGRQTGSAVTARVGRIWSRAQQAATQVRPSV